MTVLDVVRMVRERWQTVAAAAVAGLLIALIIVAVMPRTYEARTVLYVSAQSQPDNSQAAYQGGLLSEQRVKSYTQLITSERVAGEVVGRLGLPYLPQDLASSINAAAASETVLLSITVQDSDPNRAALIADTVAGVSSNLVADLERSAGPTRAPAVTLRVVQPALADPTPSSPNPPLDLLIGTILGAILGTGFVVVRNLMDTSVKGDSALRELGGAPVLGRIPEVQALRDDMASTWHPDNVGDAGAEAFRHVRTNLQFVNVDARHKVLVVSSSSASEGKTTVAINVAAALAAASYEVLLVDCDLRRPRAAQALGLESSVGLTTVLAGRARVNDAIQGNHALGLKFLASGVTPPNPSEMLGSRAMAELIEEVRSKYDFVIFDAPPVLAVTDATVLGQLADGILLVARDSVTSQKELNSAVTTIQSAGARIVGSILNAAEKERSYYAGYNTHPRRRRAKRAPESASDGSRVDTRTPSQRPANVRTGGEEDATTTQISRKP